MTIFTLTLNPVIDTHFSVNGLKIGAENYTRSMVKIAAGKGVNISRALKRHGVSAPAFLLSGSDDAEWYLSSLEARGIEAHTVTVPGPMREYVSLNDALGNTETRICYRAFHAGADAAAKLGEDLSAVLSPGDVVCISGGLPIGLGHGEVVKLARKFEDRGAGVVLDCAALSAKETKAANPWLIKPNYKEALDLLGAVGPVQGARSGPEDLRTLSERLLELSPNVLLSAGPRGAIFASRSGLFVSGAAVPIRRCYSSVGAGDNLLAGFLYHLFFCGQPADRQPAFISDESTAKAALECGLRFAAEICEAVR